MGKQYKIKTHSVTGKRKNILRSGMIVDESELRSDDIASLLRRKHIEEHTESVATIIDPIPTNKRLKIGIVTAVWKRPEIFHLFAKGIKQLERTINDVDIITIVAGSEGMASREMAESYGFIYVEKPNDPLASKHNETTLKAGRIGCDYVFCLGSDDVIHPDLFRQYIQYMQMGYDYIGVLDFYFYDTVSKKSLYWGGYKDEKRKRHTCGAGRAISRRLLEKWNFKPWEDKDSKVLDNSMQTKLRATPHSIKTFSLKEFGLFGLDIKSSTNMTPFALWDNTIEIKSSIIKENFSYLNL